MPTSSPSPSFHLTTRRPNASAAAARKDSSMKSSNNNNGHAKKPQKAPVRYRECRKNHAASIGGYAVDGCREFMASGEEGTSAALRCAACSCHRSFHKREADAEAASL